MSGIHLVNLINIPNHKYVHGMGQSRLALLNAKKNTISVQGENDRMPGGVAHHKKKVELEKTKQRKPRYNRKRRRKLQYIKKKK